MSEYTGPLWECDEPINSTILQITVWSSLKLNFHQGYFIYFSIWCYYSSGTLWATLSSDLFQVPLASYWRTIVWGSVVQKEKLAYISLVYQLSLPFILCPLNSPLPPGTISFLFLPLSPLFLSSFPSLPLSFLSPPFSFSLQLLLRLTKEAVGRECGIPSSNLQDSEKDIASLLNSLPFTKGKKAIDLVHSKHLEGMIKIPSWLITILIPMFNFRPRQWEPLVSVDKFLSFSAFSLAPGIL